MTPVENYIEQAEQTTQARREVLTDDDDDVLRNVRLPKADEVVTLHELLGFQEAQDATATVKMFLIDDKLPDYIFNYATKKPHFLFTCVRGTKLYGLLVDPGASRGLIGSETLREIRRNVLRPAGKDHLVQWTTSSATFSGISACVERSLGMVRFPIGLLGLNDCWFHGDAIGGASSTCPGLIPLKSMMTRGCLIACGYYQNKDGILGIRKDDGTFAAQRLLLTDSGHYLLPINHYGKTRTKGLDNAILHENDQLKNSAATLADQQGEAVAFVLGSAEDPYQDFQ